MNKQAFTFLTLFSLILVLSVYYMMLPPSSSDELVTHTESVIEKMQKEHEQEIESIIDKNNDIIAKETSTSDTINQALKVISEVKNQAELEKKVIDKIKLLGYKDVFVECDGQIIKVTILLNNHTKTDASKVISEVLNILGDTYQVEVKFVNE